MSFLTYEHYDGCCFCFYELVCLKLCCCKTKLSHREKCKCVAIRPPTDSHKMNQIKGVKTQDVSRGGEERKKGCTDPEMRSGETVASIYPSLELRIQLTIFKFFE